MLAAIKVEWLKLRRSRISLITTVLVGIGVPALTAGFLAAATRGPADTPLAIKVNALLIGEGWPAYLGMLAQILSVMSFLGVGFVVAWCFGREFTDHTITGLYALPTSRITIAAAKYVVLLAWSLGLSLITLAAAFALAPLAGLPAPHHRRARTGRQSARRRRQRRSAGLPARVHRQRRPRLPTRRRRADPHRRDHPDPHRASGSAPGSRTPPPACGPGWAAPRQPPPSRPTTSPSSH